MNVQEYFQLMASWRQSSQRFYFFPSPPAAARERNKTVGDTPNPGREDPASLQYAPMELVSVSLPISLAYQMAINIAL